MERVKVLVCHGGFLRVLGVVCGCGAVVADQVFVGFSRIERMVFIKMHILAVGCQRVLWGRCGAAILVSRCVSNSSFCVAGADIRAVQGVQGAVTTM